MLFSKRFFCASPNEVWFGMRRIVVPPGNAEPGAANAKHTSKS